MRSNDVNVFYVPFIVVVVDIFCLLFPLCSERDEWKYCTLFLPKEESKVSYRIRRIPFDTVRNAPEGGPSSEATHFRVLLCRPLLRLCSEFPVPYPF